MKSNELIQGKWYVCLQHELPRSSFKFDKIVSAKLFYSEFVEEGSHRVKRGFTPSYYYYHYQEVETPSESVKSTPKRKRYEKKKVEELLEKLLSDRAESVMDGNWFGLEQWKRDNL